MGDQKNSYVFKESIKILRDKWVESLPNIDVLMNGLYPDKYSKEIKCTTYYKKLTAAFYANKKVQATRIITNNLSLFIQNNEFVECLKIKEDWLFALKKRVIKVTAPLYNAIIFNEKLTEFIENHEKTFQCKLLPKAEIEKIIPHLPLKKLFKEGRLRGGLFDYKIPKWFFSKEDAERIASEKYEHIKKYQIISQKKKHGEMIESNIKYIHDYICHWIYLEGCCVAVTEEEFDHLFDSISNLPFLKHLVNNIPFGENNLGIHHKIEDYLSQWYDKKIKSNNDFKIAVNDELTRRQLQDEEDELRYN